MDSKDRRAALLVALPRTSRGYSRGRKREHSTRYEAKTHSHFRQVKGASFNLENDAIVIGDENGRLIVDYIIRFESLQQDFDQVCDTIGKARRMLAHQNRGARRHYYDYFDDDTRRIFLGHFGRDVERFGYDY